MYIPYTTLAVTYAERQETLKALQLEREARKAHEADRQPSASRIGRLVFALRPAR